MAQHPVNTALRGTGHVYLHPPSAFKFVILGHPDPRISASGGTSRSSQANDAPIPIQSRESGNPQFVGAWGQGHLPAYIDISS